MINTNRKTSIIWESWFYHSIENCFINIKEAGCEITSTITGNYGNKLFKLDYIVQTNRNWEVLYTSVFARINGLVQDVILERRNNHWFLNNKAHQLFEGFVFIDISLTPFTNTLPINCLQLKEKERQVIDVIYFDVLKNEIKTTKQVYTKLSKNIFLYENYDGSFNAKIKVDEAGFITYYPRIFKMTSKQSV